MKWTPPVELSAREQKLCKRLEKYRRFYRFLRLRRHELFDKTFQGELEVMYADKPRGQDPVAPALLATVVLLQAYAKVSDEDAVLRAETDACWQMVLDCFGVDQAPFSQGTLSNFRARLIQANLHHVLLRRTYELAKSSKEFGFKQVAALRIAVDSAPLDGAGKVEDTLNLLGRALRLLVVVIAAYFGLKREQIITEAGLTLLGAASLKAALDLDWRDEDAENRALRRVTTELDALETYWRSKMPKGTSVQTLEQVQERAALVRTQNTERGPDGRECMREGVAEDRLISWTDPEIRHGRKNATKTIDGYKKYLAEDIENRLIVAASVLPANAPERDGADKLRPEITRHGSIGELLIDTAFLSSGLCKSIDAEGGRITCRSLRASNTKDSKRFTKRDFTVDLKRGQVRCPAGKLAVIHNHQAFFMARDCRDCERRAECQKPGARFPRKISISPQEALLQRLAANDNDPVARARLRHRVAIEHALSHHCRRQGPSARYRGVVKNDFDVSRIAAVQNLLEIDRRERDASRTHVQQTERTRKYI